MRISDADRHPNLMQTDPRHGARFWAGNALLVVALLCLLFLDTLAQWLGTWAMALWMGLAAVGVYLIVADGK